MAGTQIRRRVHDPRDHGGLLGELVHRRGLLEHLVVQNGQPSARIGPQPNPLDGRGAVADNREQLLTTESDPDRTVEHSGRHSRQHRLRSGAALGPEPPADMLRKDPYAAVVEPEKLHEGLMDPGGALIGVIDREPIAVPIGGGGVGLHRVVVLRWRRVRLLDHDLRASQAGLDVPGERVGREIRVDVIGGEQSWVVG